MDVRRLTQWTLIAVFILLIAFDIAVYAHEGVHTTISRVIMAWSQRNPAVTFISGFICGHLFWGQPQGGT